MLHRDLLPRLRGWDATLDTVADHDFVLRAAEHVRHVRHLPQVLYRRGHARHAMPDSALAATQRRHAVDAHLRRLALPAAALPHPTVPGRVQIVPTPAAPRPRVSIVVSVSDRPVALRRCLATLFAKTAYDGWDVLAVERGPVRSGTEAVMREWARVRHDRFHRFRAGVERTAASALNAAVAAVTGELLVFLHDDVEVIDPGWLDQLALLASVEGVGAVGPLLLRPDGRVHHAGLAITPDGTAVPVMRGLPADGDGHEGSLCCVREVEAVTAACLMVRRRLFLETGGFDEHFATDCRDVDLCLRLRAAGFTNLFAADSRLVQRAGGARTPAADPLDRHALVDRWEHRRPLEDRYHPGDVPCYRPQPGGWRWRR